MYVGSAVNFARRVYGHKYHLIKNKHDNIKLQAAWNKYGQDNFDFLFIEPVDDVSKLIEREQFWINFLDAVNLGYNLCPHAGSRLGKKHSQQTIEKMIAASTGTKRTKETRAKMSAWQIGKKHSQETKDRISAGNTGKKRAPGDKNKRFTGKKHTEEHKKKMSEMRAGIKFSEEHKEKMKKAWVLRRFRNNSTDVCTRKVS